MASISWPPWETVNSIRMQNHRSLTPWPTCPTIPAMPMWTIRKIWPIAIRIKATWTMRIWTTTTIRQWWAIATKTSQLMCRIAATVTLAAPSPIPKELVTIKRTTGMTHCKGMRRQMVTLMVTMPIMIAFKIRMPILERQCHSRKRHHHRRLHNNRMHYGMHFTILAVPGILIAFRVAISDCTAKIRMWAPRRRTIHTITTIIIAIYSTSITIWWNQPQPTHKIPIKVCSIVFRHVFCSKIKISSLTLCRVPSLLHL